ncbi:YHS domain-containing (seleno)protein [Maribacter litoralis]|uniref:YHS domain-containing (seleno)protein n=1 Tax=Maribacter litoralis TaxID=2059726 RepID=UPI003F5CDD17
MTKYISNFIVLLVFTTSISLQAQTENRNLNGQLAIKGYDPVAYFTKNKAIKGKKSLKADSDGAIYYFSSEEHKNLFKENPEKYTPEYGGWCAYAMGDSGEKVSIDPETFIILDGKLYLFYHTFFSNTLNSWNEDERHLKQEADKNWKKLIR